MKKKGLRSMIFFSALAGIFGFLATAVIVITAPLWSPHLLLKAAQTPSASALNVLFSRNSYLLNFVNVETKIRALNFTIRSKNGGLMANLIEAGVPLSSESYYLQPLYIAAAEGNLEIAKLLIANGANINPNPDLLMGTPIWGAVANNQLEMVRFLISQGADPIPTRFGERSAIEYAKERNFTAVVRELEAHRASSRLQNSRVLSSE